MSEEKITVPMALRPFFERVKELEGRASDIDYEKEIEPKKKFEGKLLGRLTKHSTFNVRAGVDYEDIQTVKEAHESGERERRGLPESMKKVDTGCYYNTKKDRWYVGCTPIDGERQSEFLLDGQPIELDEAVTDDGDTLEDVLYANDKNSKHGDWLQLPVENIKDMTGI